MEDIIENFLGRGWKFPIEFESETVAMLTGEDDIKNSLDVLFATDAGERVMHSSYGSALSNFLFSPVNQNTITYMTALIRKEILFNEPRIIVHEIRVFQSRENNARLDINIEYTVALTNNRYNYVYPFYINEATNLQR